MRRPYRDRFVTLYPDELQMDPLSYYDHAINIITLGHKQDDKLFTAPKYPGEHYNMTLELYSGDVLVEKSVINMTNV